MRRFINMSLNLLPPLAIDSCIRDDVTIHDNNDRGDKRGGMTRLMSDDRRTVGNDRARTTRPAMRR